MDLEEVGEERTRLPVAIARETARPIREGRRHNGEGSVIQVLGTRL